MTRSTVLALGVLVGVFVLGALSGAATTYAYTKREQAELVGPGHPGRRMRGLERRLDLTADQSRQIEAIFSRHADEMERLKGEMFEGCGQPMRDKIDAVDAEIRAVLTPEQQSRFDQLIAERKQRGLNGPPGPQGRGPHGRGPHGPRGMP